MKRLTVLFATLVMVFGFSAGAMADIHYGVWEDSAPGAATGVYEWTSGDLIGTPHDYVEVKRVEDSWGWEEVWYTFSMDDIVAPPPAYKEVSFEASWLATQHIFSSDPLWYEVNYITPEGYNASDIDEEWLDTDGNGEIDGFSAHWRIIEDGCPPWEAINIYDYTWGEDADGNHWYIESARMETNCVPIPGAVYLLGSGLLGLIGLRRKQRAHS